ncbi:VanZ family protein [Agriterribacter sp.]|uniref:VanZ family protein n=1 Tax=Agriterribacter sp. TaxID=2821509 RepID=UPI002B7E520D|nr:VanZ family protein [Agriterribacter sp.]HTN07865.1 VanZ family protein [Agriterribacter sp.]
MKKNLLHAIWPAIVWSVIIFILLTIPGQDFPAGPKIPFLDKVIHVFLFGVQVFLWCRFIDRIKTPHVLWIFLLIFLISCIYGIVMEYVQLYWIANRGFETGDILADITGSMAGWLIYRYYFLKKQEVV